MENFQIHLQVLLFYKRTSFEFVKSQFPSSSIFLRLTPIVTHSMFYEAKNHNEGNISIKAKCLKPFLPDTNIGSWRDDLSGVPDKI